MSRVELIRAILSRLDENVAVDWSKTAEGTPTRYAIIDDLLPEEITRRIHGCFPPQAEGFRVLDSFREKKRQAFDLSNRPELLADIVYALQSKPVVERIGELTGIEGLDGDPTLYAGGVSMMLPGDFLNPHIDNSHEATRRKYRRINSLFYVTPDWVESNGGNLELWDDKVSEPVTIVSTFNRLVLMETNDRSWHSVSPVVAGPPRCCVSNYYFSEASPNGEEYYHVTSFTGRPEQPLRRLWCSVDNAARLFARKALKLRRRADAGYVQGRAQAEA
ncbi:2OG-Fe(II) oxygenase [Brevundimonas sp.]|uniref:2OG-Fe(II) oxygenase n=1 Tax=Brevundimonas sp. TaxID=1871086 RepID=UPI002D5DD927|nr:2OG-Fe(II) oxygenase [Brevundimonas sp.]HYC74873.1 2OG-Fe(II) oxygenase [Brevundimonas sp.]